MAFKVPGSDVFGGQSGRARHRPAQLGAAPFRAIARDGAT